MWFLKKKKKEKKKKKCKNGFLLFFNNSNPMSSGAQLFYTNVEDFRDVVEIPMEYLCV